MNADPVITSIDEHHGGVTMSMFYSHLQDLVDQWGIDSPADFKDEKCKKDLFLLYVDKQSELLEGFATDAHATHEAAMKERAELGARAEDVLRIFLAPHVVDIENMILEDVQSYFDSDDYDRVYPSDRSKVPVEVDAVAEAQEDFRRDIARELAALSKGAA